MRPVYLPGTCDYDHIGVLPEPGKGDTIPILQMRL